MKTSESSTAFLRLLKSRDESDFQSSAKLHLCLETLCY